MVKKADFRKHFPELNMNKSFTQLIFIGVLDKDEHNMTKSALVTDLLIHKFSFEVKKKRNL